MSAGRETTASTFVGRFAEAAKKRHTERVERVETRTEALPAELADAVAALTTQMLDIKRDIAELQRALGEFYMKTERKAGA